MALLFFDGFENQLTSRWSISGAGTTTGRFGGGKALDMDTGTVSGTDIADTAPFSIAAGGTIIVGHAVYVRSITRNPQRILACLGSGSVMWELQANANGVLRFVGGQFNVVTGAVLTQDTWHYVEVKVQMTEVNGFAQVRVDGVEVINTGLGDPITTAEREATQIRLQSTQGWDDFRDDVYVCDGLGGINDDFLGDVYVKQVLPSGQGNHADGIGSDGNSIDNYLLVDEATADTDDWVALAQNGDMESYTIPALDTGEVPIGVRIASLNGFGDQSQEITHFLRIGATNYLNALTHNVLLAYGWSDSYWNSNPATAVAWAEDDLDGAEIGVRRSA